MDGIRMDGVSSMLYLNFGVSDPARRRTNARGGEEDLDAVAFVRQVNGVMAETHPDVLMVAEESTAWPRVTAPVADGGLGFTLKWDMGWMNDTLHYLQTDFPYRPSNQRLLTFSSMYQFSERFVLPLSHDEVVNGKCSLIVRQPGDIWRKFAGMRALALYQMTHPGAKLTFMGDEIAQFIEWRYYEGIEYFLPEQFKTHRAFQGFVRALNRFYVEHGALWRRGFEPAGFSWIDADDADQSIVSFVRRGGEDDDELVVLLNFGVAAHEGFRLGVPAWGVWGELLNSDDERFGGSGVTNAEALPCEDVAWNGQGQSVVVRVPPLGGMVLERTGAQPRPVRVAPPPSAPGPDPARRRERRR